jgi:transcriptional antiterminator NusG
MDGGLTIGEAARAAGMMEEAAAPSTDLPWHIVHCFGRSDDRAAAWLKGRGFSVYSPMIWEIRKVPRRELSKHQRAQGIEIKRPRLIPCLPRYLFVRFDIGQEGWREAFEFAGVGGMVCAGGQPVRISDAEIACMQNEEVDGGIPGVTTLRVVFKVGQRVRVTEGPFASFPGEVERGLDIPMQDLAPDARIRVAVMLFGRATPVELELSQVEKL